MCEATVLTYFYQSIYTCTPFPSPRRKFHIFWQFFFQLHSSLKLLEVNKYDGISFLKRLCQISDSVFGHCLSTRCRSTVCTDLIVVLFIHASTTIQYRCMQNEVGRSGLLFTLCHKMVKIAISQRNFICGVNQKLLMFLKNLMIFSKLQPEVGR